ncbi:Hypothetical predicted protein [Mytilus galloprovincialis]|uniref:Uncharacterized protein n=1 Tax=Mytilus galloprovincialis TaxID=29158 RepID=A0A8B6FDP9_MYTGA|nr:Hypothetical predicted protein [Mytilus galloprovincialis]
MDYYSIFMLIENKPFYLTYETIPKPVVKVMETPTPPKWELVKLPTPTAYCLKDVNSMQFLNVATTGIVTCESETSDSSNFTLPGGLKKSKITNSTLQPNMTLYVDAGTHKVSGKYGADGQEWTFQK